MPVDDGAADHLPGSEVPAVALPSTLGGELDLAGRRASALVVYVYPRTGTPGRAAARRLGRHPRRARLHAAELRLPRRQRSSPRHGATLIGISAQTPAEQAEFAEREHIPYPLLSDHELKLAEAMGLPTFETSGLRLYKRLTFVAEQGRIVKVFYPVFPPDRNADEVLAWLDSR